jgi:hypothetical protein
MMMATPDHDTGVIQVLLERLNSQRLPMAQALKKKVDRGETLSDHDMGNLDDILAHAREIQPLLDRHPDYKDLVGQIMTLYKEILDKALENEKKKGA